VPVEKFSSERTGGSSSGTEVPPEVRRQQGEEECRRAVREGRGGEGGKGGGEGGTGEGEGMGGGGRWWAVPK
jgi:hypothetical protein